MKKRIKQDNSTCLNHHHMFTAGNQHARGLQGPEARAGVAGQHDSAPLLCPVSAAVTELTLLLFLLKPGKLGLHYVNFNRPTAATTPPDFPCSYLTRLSLANISLEVTRPPRFEWRGLLRTMTSTVSGDVRWLGHRPQGGTEIEPLGVVCHGATK